MPGVISNPPSFMKDILSHIWGSAEPLYCSLCVWLNVGLAGDEGCNTYYSLRKGKTSALLFSLLALNMGVACEETL